MRQLRRVLAGAAAEALMERRTCPLCRFVASATTLELMWEALFQHFEALHPKDA